MKSVGIGLSVLVLVASGAGAGVTTNVLDAEVRVAGEAALRRGVTWLERQQAKDGGLGGAEYPAAVTALAVSALKAGGSTNQAVQRAAGSRLHTPRNSDAGKVAALDAPPCHAGC